MQTDDGDWDDEADIDHDVEDEPTVSCPHCGHEILEDSPWCPNCERYISAEDHAGPRKPTWMIVTALISLGIAIWWALAG